jgi:hypothetical protein
MSLALFVVPGVALFPFKFIGLYLVAHGQKTLGFFVFAAAKLIGTGLVAWVYALTESQLSKLVWFVRLRGKFLSFKAAIYQAMRESLLYRFTRRRLHSLKSITVNAVSHLKTKIRAYFKS